MPITERNKRFAEALSTSKNATEAAITAGYSPKTAAQIASRLKRNGIPDQLMAQYNADAFDSLHKVAKHGTSEMARVKASDSLLARTYDMPYNTEQDNKRPSITIQVSKLSDLTK